MLSCLLPKFCTILWCPFPSSLLWCTLWPCSSSFSTQDIVTHSLHPYISPTQHNILAHHCLCSSLITPIQQNILADLFVPPSKLSATLLYPWNAAGQLLYLFVLFSKKVACPSKITAKYCGGPSFPQT